MSQEPHIIFASGGNDSVALVQWAHEERMTHVNVAYSNTGWAATWWPLRMVKFQAWVESLGFIYHEIPSEGMESLIVWKKAWPANKPKFCTFELKIKPAQAWLDKIDPAKDAICMVGVRREESAERRNWPRNIDRSESHGGRVLFSPLVEYTEAERNELILRAGYTVLPHRSKECSPCVTANRADFRLLEEPEIDRVRRNEASTGRNMFRPHRFQGAKGIDEVLRWARSAPRKYNKDQPELQEQSGCDSGMCGN